MRILPAIIAAGTIITVLFWLGLTEARAYDDCQAWAAFVDVASKSEQPKRARQFEAWKRLTDDKRKLQTILRAQAYVRAGGTADQAWRSCAGY